MYTLFCFGYERQISLTSLADGVVTVVATALLVWKWGAIGAPLGAIAGVVLVSLPLNLRSVAQTDDGGRVSHEWPRSSIRQLRRLTGSERSKRRELRCVG